MTPEISVIIVSWNAHRFLHECLTSLRTGVRARLEVIVIDNASSDKSPDMVETEFPEVRLIRNTKNLGFAAANNQGIKASKGRYLALVNSDVNVFPGCLDSLLRYMDENPFVGVSGPRILNSDRTLQSSCRQFPNLWNNFCEASGLSKLFPGTRWLAGEHMLYFKHDQSREVDVLVGCFLFARSEAVKEFGFLDERFFMYAEDVDWCWRCWRAGWKVSFYPECESVHYRGGSSSNDPVRFSIEQQFARLQLWKKHRSRFHYLAFVCLLASQHSARWVANLLISALSSKSASLRRRQNAACLKALFRVRTA